MLDIVQLVKAVTQQHCVYEFSLCESRGLFVQSLGSEAQASVHIQCIN